MANLSELIAEMHQPGGLSEERANALAEQIFTAGVLAAYDRPDALDRVLERKLDRIKRAGGGTP